MVHINLPFTVNNLYNPQPSLLHDIVRKMWQFFDYCLFTGNMLAWFTIHEKYVITWNRNGSSFPSIMVRSWVCFESLRCRNTSNTVVFSVCFTCGLCTPHEIWLQTHYSPQDHKLIHPLLNLSRPGIITMSVQHATSCPHTNVPPRLPILWKSGD